MPVHPIARIPPGSIHKRTIRVGKHTSVNGTRPGELFPPVAPKKPPSIEDEVRARLEGGSANVPAYLPQEGRPALIEGVAAHSVKQNVTALIDTHVNNLGEVITNTPKEARHRTQDALLLAISIGAKVPLEWALILRRESSPVVPIIDCPGRPHIAPVNGLLPAIDSLHVTESFGLVVRVAWGNGLELHRLDLTGARGEH